VEVEVASPFTQDLVRTEISLFSTFGDDCAWPSVATLVKKTGRSERSVQYALRRLEADGEIVCLGHTLPDGRRVRTRVYRIAPEALRAEKPRTTAGSRRFAPQTRSGPSRRPKLGRRRHLVENHPEVVDEGVVDRNGVVRPWNAADCVAAVVDTLRLYDVPIVRSWRGIVGRRAKELLDDGFAPEVVVASCVIAIRRGQPQIAHCIAMDAMLVQQGQHLSRMEYDREIAAAKARMLSWPGGVSL